MCFCTKCNWMIPCSLAISGFPCGCTKNKDAWREWANGKGFAFACNQIEKRANIELIDRLIDDYKHTKITIEKEGDSEDKDYYDSILGVIEHLEIEKKSIKQKKVK